MSVADGETMHSWIEVTVGTAMADTGTGPGIEKAVGTGRQICAQIAEMAVGDVGCP